MSPYEWGNEHGPGTALSIAITFVVGVVSAATRSFWLVALAGLLAAALALAVYRVFYPGGLLLMLLRPGLGFNLLKRSSIGGQVGVAEEWLRCDRLSQTQPDGAKFDLSRWDTARRKAALQHLLLASRFPANEDCDGLGKLLEVCSPAQKCAFLWMLGVYEAPLEGLWDKLVGCLKDASPGEVRIAAAELLATASSRLGRETEEAKRKLKTLMTTDRCVDVRAACAAAFGHYACDPADFGALREALVRAYHYDPRRQFDENPAQQRPADQMMWACFVPLRSWPSEPATAELIGAAHEMGGGWRVLILTELTKREGSFALCKSLFRIFPELDQDLRAARRGEARERIKDASDSIRLAVRALAQWCYPLAEELLLKRFAPDSAVYEAANEYFSAQRDIAQQSRTRQRGAAA